MIHAGDELGFYWKGLLGIDEIFTLAGRRWVETGQIMWGNFGRIQAVSWGETAVALPNIWLSRSEGRNPPMCVGRIRGRRKDLKASMESQSFANKNFLLPSGSYSNLSSSSSSNPLPFNCVFGTTMLSCVFVDVLIWTFRLCMASI